jgi:hypothetical protein
MTTRLKYYQIKYLHGQLNSSPISDFKFLISGIQPLRPVSAILIHHEGYADPKQQIYCPSYLNYLFEPPTNQTSY